MARALLKKRSAIWHREHPAGEASWYVNEIEYVNSPEHPRGPARLAFCRASPYNYPLIFDPKMN
jgi:hypothetical protein